MEGRKFFIDEDFANAVLEYLSKQPFREVHLFVAGFQDLRLADETEKKESI